MPIGTLLVALALLLMVVVVVALPLLERRAPAVEPPSRAESLEAEHKASIRAIRELDEDFRAGKLTEPDYAAMRGAQIQRGASALRERDALRAQTGALPSAAARDADIEARILALRKTTPASPESACPNCGHAIHAGDRFCANCGATLGEPTSRSRS